MGSSSRPPTPSGLRAWSTSSRKRVASSKELSDCSPLGVRLTSTATGAWSTRCGLYFSPTCDLIVDEPAEVWLYRQAVEPASRYRKVTSTVLAREQVVAGDRDLLSFGVPSRWMTSSRSYSGPGIAHRRSDDGDQGDRSPLAARSAPTSLCTSATSSSRTSPWRNPFRRTADPGDRDDSLFGLGGQFGVRVGCQ